MTDHFDLATATHHERAERLLECHNRPEAYASEDLARIALVLEALTHAVLALGDDHEDPPEEDETDETPEDVPPEPDRISHPRLGVYVPSRTALAHRSLHAAERISDSDERAAAFGELMRRPI